MISRPRMAFSLSSHSWCNVPDANAIAIMAGDSGAVATPATLVSPVPLLAGDLISTLNLYFASAGDNNPSALRTAVFELYSCAQKPANYAEARNGDRLLPAATLPLLFNLADAVGTTVQVYIKLSIPIGTVLNRGKPWLALLVGSDETLSGAGFAHVERG